MVDSIMIRRSAVRVPMSAGGRATLILLVATVAAVLPFATNIVGPVSGFLTLVMSCVLLLDALSFYLLLSRFGDTGDRRLLWTALAYLWSSVLVIGYCLSFPGFVSKVAPLGRWHSASPWLYVCWHVGFPAILALAWAPRANKWSTDLAVERRHRAMAVSSLACAGVAACVVTFITVYGSRLLPVLIVGTDTARMTRITGAPAMVISVLSAVIVTRGLRGRSGPERWVAVAAWTCVADLTLTFESGQRFSIGWFAGRSLTVVGASLVFLAIFREFTALQRRLIGEQEQLSRQARTDQLTGLANRFAMLEHLSQTLRDSRDDVLVFVDLDRFKNVNDSLGHEAGDSVITETGRRLRQSNGPDDFAARLGGDEFALLLRGPLSDAEVAARCQRILAAVQLPYELTVGGSVTRSRLGVSLGVTYLSNHEEPAEAMRGADLALYRAKEDGRNRFVVFDDTLHDEAAGRLALEVVIRTALDGGRFVPYLRPIVRLVDQVTVGHEVLLRLEQHDGPIALPAGLLEIAESSGLITELDHLTLATAVALLRDTGITGGVHVNLSSLTILNPALEDTIRKIGLETGTGRHRLSVELREHVLLEDGEVSAASVDAFRSAGIRVGLARFGTGYSALGSLRRFQLDFIKIDPDFVAALPDDDEGGRRVLKVFFEMGAAFGFDVVADGIDSLCQVQTLIELGCRSGQGDFFGGSVPASGLLSDGGSAVLPDAADSLEPILVGAVDRRSAGTHRRPLK